MVIDKDEAAETVRQKVKEVYEASDGVLKYLIIYGCNGMMWRGRIFRNGQGVLLYNTSGVYRP